MIVVYSGDRAWRHAVEQALSARGVPARIASRPAELAKSLADGVVRAVLVGPGSDDHAVVAKAVTAFAAIAVAVIRTSPGESTESVVRRAMDVV
jgi:hypothetical protein